MPRFCAEHRHEIPGFEKAGDRLDSLTKYQEVFEYEQPNLAKAGKFVGVGASALVVGVTGGIAAAPAVGGAVGTALTSYTEPRLRATGLLFSGADRWPRWAARWAHRW